jgi:hypothetical protein
VFVKIFMKSALVLSALVSTQAFAQGGYGSAGCGLGSFVFGNTEGFEQVFAATLNGTAGSQTFGISSGTSNCKAGGKRTLVGSQEDFFLNNYATISREAAQGKGESINALASAFGCDSQMNGAFGAHIQSNYESIFASNNALTSLTATRTSLQSNSNLASVCKNITL